MPFHFQHGSCEKLGKKNQLSLFFKRVEGIYIVTFQYLHKVQRHTLVILAISDNLPSVLLSSVSVLILSWNIHEHTTEESLNYLFHIKLIRL